MGTLTNFQKLDSFCFLNNILKIDFLKIDVDGNDFDILMSCKGMLENGKVNIIQIEYGWSNSKDGIGWGQKYELKHLFDAFDNWKIYKINMRGLHLMNDWKSTLEESKKEREQDYDYIYHNFLICRNELDQKTINDIYNNTISSKRIIESEELFYILKRVYGSIESVFQK